ncbi:MAG: PPOX class F420-dependent oxidoreductase [Acidimicrobiales bacterium]
MPTRPPNRWGGGRPRRPNGSLQNNPVGFRYDETTGTVTITGRALGPTRRFANVADNAAVALVVDDRASRDPWTVRRVEIRCVAEALVDQEPASNYASADPGRHGRDIAPGP